MVDRSVIKSKLSSAESRLIELKGFRSISEAEFENNRTVQAAILHHLQVAIQACGDVASHIVADEGWGVPGTTAELFDVLAQHRVIPLELAKKRRR